MAPPTGWPPHHKMAAATRPEAVPGEELRTFLRPRGGNGGRILQPPQQNTPNEDVFRGKGNLAWKRVPLNMANADPQRLHTIKYMRTLLAELLAL